jgi:hypothetical protein
MQPIKKLTRMSRILMILKKIIPKQQNLCNL